MKYIVAASVFIVISGCSTATTTSASKSASKSNRDPSSIRSFESMPLCSRIKYIYLKPKVDIRELPESFQSSAAKDSNKFWNAGKTMLSDTDDVGGCSPQQAQDLLKKPDSCKSVTWSGPYIDESLFKNYENLTDEDFKLFSSCWQN